MYYYRLISSMLKAVISTLGTGLYAVYKGESDALASLTTSLYAVYKGESNTNDSLGNYNGTAQGGLTYTAGKSGNCFVPNGTTGYVALPDNALNGLGQTFTIALWFNPSGFVAGFKEIISTYNNNSGNDYGFEFGHASDGTDLKFVIYGSSTVSLSAAPFSMSRNVWNFVLLERIAGTGTSIYVNNTLVASNTSAVDVRYYSTMYASIGAFKYGTSSVSQYLSANYNYDEVNFWNRALTTQEKTDLYNSGNGKFYQGNTFSSTIVNDSLATYNGTAQGGLTYTAGKSGNAFVFNGTSAYVQLPDNSLNFLTSFTIGWWMNLGGTSLDAQQPISNAQRSAGGSTIWGYGVYIQNSIINFQVMDGTNYVALTWNMASINNWAYFEIEREWNVGSKIRVNGSVVASNTSTINPAYRLDVVHTPAIGVYKNTTGNNYFMSSGGKIDEVNIWNRLLTATEVTELYNAGAGKFYPY